MRVCVSASRRTRVQRMMQRLDTDDMAQVERMVDLNDESARAKLHGTVDYIEQSEACSDITRRIKGVREIANYLHIAETGRRGKA